MTAHAAAAHFALADTYRIVGFSSPRFSPDGRDLLFVRSRVNLQTDQRDGQLVVLRVKTGAQRTVLSGRNSVGDPQWSPHGRRIAFLAYDHRHGRQVYVQNASGGAAVAVTHAANGVQEYAWRPDGRAIAYLTTRRLPKKRGIARWQDAFQVTDNGYLTPGPYPPGILELSTRHGAAAAWRAVTLVGAGQGASVATGAAASTISWAPDGRTLAYVRTPNALLGDAERSTVQTVDLTTRRVRPLTGRTRFEFNPRISPRGGEIAYTYARDGDPMNVADVFVSPMHGVGRDVSRAMDRNDANYTWYPDGSALLVNADDGTQRCLWRLNLDGTFRKLPLGDVSAIGNFDGSIARDGTIAFVGLTPRHPAEIYVLPPRAGAPVRLTGDNASIAARDLGRVRRITWTGPAPQHFAEDGVLTYPADFHAGERYPLVLLIHGGPTGASTATFDQLAQLMAARGWFVLEPNYRGSDNLGNAYQRAIYADPTRGPGEDVMAGLAAVRRIAPIDPARICVSGWSYGGLLASWLVTQQHLWRCAVSGAGVDDLVYDYALADDIGDDREVMPGSPFTGDNLQLYRASSPLTYYRSVRTPTLLLSDMFDVRVPAAESYAFYHALHDAGVTVRFYEWPVYGHFPSDPVRTADVYRRWIDWIARYVSHPPHARGK